MENEFSKKLKSIADKYRTIGYWLSVEDIQIDDTKYYLLLIKNGGDLDLLYAKFDSESNRWYTRNNMTFVTEKHVLLISYIDMDSLKERLVSCPF